MTITIYQLLLYAGALAILFLTPGPVWIAIVARTLTGGYRAAWPLALGVAIGDIVWPLMAILGITWILSVFTGFMTFLRFVASIIFIVMGVLIIRNADKTIATDTRLTRPGMWAGFAAGVAVILSNPKAILFYMGVLPGFFDLSKRTWPDVTAILALSMIVPFLGNVALALLVERMRVLITSPNALHRISFSAGIMLIFVGLVIPFI